jgi:hypothetical protein
MSKVCTDALTEYDSLIQTEVGKVIKKYEISKKYVTSYDDALVVIRKLQSQIQTTVEEAKRNALQQAETHKAELTAQQEKLETAHKQSLESITKGLKTQNVADIETAVSAAQSELQTSHDAAVQQIKLSYETEKENAQTQAIQTKESNDAELTAAIGSKLQELTDEGALHKLREFIPTMNDKEPDYSELSPYLGDIDSDLEPVSAKNSTSPFDAPALTTRRGKPPPRTSFGLDEHSGGSRNKRKRAKRTKKRRRY